MVIIIIMINPITGIAKGVGKTMEIHINQWDIKLINLINGMMVYN